MSYSQLISEYAPKGILIDTNLLLLYIIGISNEKRILTYKRTKQFLIEDFKLLGQFLLNFQKIIITPNILTEVNSFLNQLEEREKEHSFNVFDEIIKRTNEKYIESKTLSADKKFYKYGLTDLSIEKLSSGKYLVLTDDFKLYNYLLSQKIDVINFNHIRVLNW